MRLNRILFICSVIIFLFSWGIKANMPVDRPSNLEDEREEAWYEKEYSHIYGDDDWYLAAKDPENYTPVKGYDDIYQYKKADGTVIYYRQETDKNGKVTYVELKDFVP